MMNLLAVSLLLASLFTAQVWSPNPKQEEDVIVKEGHRVIVVETFDDEGGQHNTKVSISPSQDHISSGGVIENAKEKVKRAAHVLPNIGQGISSSPASYEGPGELICDAFGKCTHRIAKVIEKAKEKVEDAYDKAHEATDRVAHEAKEMAREGIDRKKRIVHEAKERVEDAYERASDITHEAKEAVTQKAQQVKESAGKAAKDARDLRKTIGVDTAYERASDKTHEAKEAVTRKAQQVKESAGKAAKDAKDIGKSIAVDTVKNVSEKTGQAKTVVLKSCKRAFRYVGSKEGILSLMGAIHLLGFSVAYGMCFWVTFISSHVLANTLNRQQFGLVQSKLYPVYFRALCYSIGVALFGHLMGRKEYLFTRKAEVFQVFNLLASLSMVLINALYLEPLATKVMIEKLKIEKEEGRGESRRVEQEAVGDVQTTIGNSGSRARTVAENQEQEEIRSKIGRSDERLKKLNGYSSLLNILSWMGLTWHLVYLGQCFK